MDATIFSYDTDIVFNNFNKVLKLLVFCYEKMISEISFKLDEFETFIRNILIKNYLQNKDFKEKFWIKNLRFLSEVQEIWEDYKTLWFIDIQVHNINPNDLWNENEYFAFECKRLDGYATKNKEYINNWVKRFEKGQYSKEMKIAWMIWFIQWYKKWENISNIINFFISKISWLSFYEVDTTFKHSYHSNHKRNKKLWNIYLYHLFFDFT